MQTPQRGAAKRRRIRREIAEDSYDYRHDVPEGYSRSRKRKGKKRKSTRRGRDAKGHFLPKRGKARKGSSRRRRNPLPNPVRRHRRKARRNPIRHHRRHYSRRRNPFPNPIPNPMSGPMEFISALFGVGVGYALASALDRYAAGHALTNVNGTLMDAPAAGQIYDSEAPMLPIWQNWERLAFAGGAVAAPLVLAGVLGGGARQAMALVALGALVRTAGKALEDGIATLGTTQPLVQQLYAPEIAAATRQAQANLTTLPQAAPGTFAGLPRGYRSIAAPQARQLGMGDCGPNAMITDPVADRNAFFQGMSQPASDPYTAANYGCSCGTCSQCQQTPPQTSTFNPMTPTPPTPIVAPPTPTTTTAPPASNTFPMPPSLPPVTPASGYMIPPIQQQPPSTPSQPSAPSVPNLPIPGLTTVFPNGPAVYTPR